MAASVSILSERVPVVYTHYAGASHTVLYQYRPWVMLDSGASWPEFSAVGHCDGFVRPECVEGRYGDR